jgi:hypothetical protein
VVVILEVVANKTMVILVCIMFLFSNLLSVVVVVVIVANNKIVILVCYYC